ncbi:MAG: EAL domain-containing protein [Bacilli bacterium]|nr:EAL domain-containing protein [Bacilli bacterium]
MKSNKKRYLVPVIISGPIFVGLLIFLAVGQFSGFFSGNLSLSNLIITLAIITAIIFAVVLSWYVNRLSIVKTLEAENEYNLGARTAFNNLFAFQKRLETMTIFYQRRKYSEHIVAFTFSSMVVSQNVNRNNEIYLLNSHIASFLETLYQKINTKRRYVTFAFSRGNFLIAVFRRNEQQIEEMCEIISKEIYEFANNKCPHIWVQPFFGVTIVKKAEEELLTHQIENAMLARDFSERNFETITYYQPTFRKSVAASDVEELTEALEKKEFVVFYQPKFDVTNRRFISSEALIRWNSKKYGLLSPTKFLNKAEAVGLIHDIDVYVLKQVCEDLNDMIRRGRRVLPVSVNFSLYEFYSANFLDTIMDILDEFKIPTNLIEIEVTEATSQANQFLSISIIRKLKDRGIRVLMDDFGIGFSNVGNLKKIPFDVVKIDKSFIDDIVTDTKSREIVKFLIGLCKINGMEVVAEGVDNKEQVEILRKAKCDTIQGFYYSQALSKKEFEKFLLDNPFEKKEGVKA